MNNVKRRRLIETVSQSPEVGLAALEALLQRAQVEAYYLSLLDTARVIAIASASAIEEARDLKDLMSKDDTRS
jgi:hypothetical protein